MKENKVNFVLKGVLKKISPDEELKDIEKILKVFTEKIENRIKKLKLNAEVFVGGSFAKKTMIKKEEHDIDIFLRFDGKHKNISELTEKILKGIKKRKIHGSRDYFEIKTSKNLLFEIIPVLKIKKPKDAENVTDLSYLHVGYIRRKIKSEKMLNEIKIAKSFCYSNGFYGAESYIKGFSGYALELLVYNYGSFMKFIKEMQKSKDKIIIDLERHFKNKQDVLMNINEAKLKSPIILIDPTYKQRNALAALSYETFEKFKKTCGKFIKNPSIKFFEERKWDLKKIKDNANKNKLEFISIEIKTDKQDGDIAGTKMLKFYNHLENEISRFFYIKDKGFDYGGGKTGKCFFSAKKKKENLHLGPMIN